MIIIALMLPVALYLSYVGIFPKTKGQLRPIKVPVNYEPRK
ncbi:hypothetical protein ACEZ3G_00405 [Maribacter algicola]|uniref:Uncharacterized protein n=1 Tax=Meishania litoralis TaxID=3434685 RepID=A0ACC7LEH4_9FLAO